MKVALCSDWVPPSIGGVQSHITGLASELIKREHEVVIITKEMADNNGNDCPSYINRIRTIKAKKTAPIPLIIVPPSPSEIQGVLKREHFDVIHAHHAFTPTSLVSIATAKDLGIPTVLTNHSICIANESDSLWRPMSYFLFPFRYYINEADRIIAVSEAAAEFIGHFVKRRNIIVIPNGVDVHHFTDLKFAVPNIFDPSLLDKPSILYVGRLGFRKGLHILLGAMPGILEEAPQAQLLIAGNGYMRPFLRFYVKSLHLQDNVKFLGFIPKDVLPWLYNLSDVFVLPSISESFGITLIEAMASGKPIVASNVGGVPEIIENGVNGILFKNGDKRELSDAVLKVFSDPLRAKEYGKKARKKAEERYSWPVVVKAIEEVYKDVM